MTERGIAPTFGLYGKGHAFGDVNPIRALLDSRSTGVVTVGGSYTTVDWRPLENIARLTGDLHFPRLTAYARRALADARAPFKLITVSCTAPQKPQTTPLVEGSNSSPYQKSAQALKSPTRMTI